MSREKLPQLIVDIGDRLKDEFSPAPLKMDGSIWDAMERLRSAEKRVAAEGQDTKPSLLARRP